jgi:hypothetical protein
MFVVFSPWNHLKHAAFLGVTSAALFYDYRHSVPGSDEANFTWWMGLTFAIPAVILGGNALRWWFAGLRLYLRGPER